MLGVENDEGEMEKIEAQGTILDLSPSGVKLQITYYDTSRFGIDQLLEIHFSVPLVGTVERGSLRIRSVSSPQKETVIVGGTFGDGIDDEFKEKLRQFIEFHAEM